jgi:hypothetical protein
MGQMAPASRMSTDLVTSGARLLSRQRTDPLEFARMVTK